MSMKTCYHLDCSSREIEAKANTCTIVGARTGEHTKAHVTLATAQVPQSSQRKHPEQRTDKSLAERRRHSKEREFAEKEERIRKKYYYYDSCTGASFFSRPLVSPL